MRKLVLSLCIIILIVFSFVSCTQTIPGIGDTAAPNQPTPSPTPSATPVPTGTSAVTPVSSETPSPPPDLVFVEHEGMVTMTDHVTGFCITFPIEYKHIMKFGYSGGSIQCWLNFDFSQEPFNDPYTEYCASHVYIDLYKEELDWIDTSFPSVKTDDGSDLYVIERYEEESGLADDTEPVIGFQFACADIPYCGTVMVKKRHETAVMNMLKSITVVPDPVSAVSVQQPPDVRALTTPNNHTRLYVPSFGISFPLPTGFEKVMSYYGSEDFMSITFDFTKAPFNEPDDYFDPSKIDYPASEIIVYLYRDIHRSYPGYGEFILFANDLGPNLIYIDMYKDNSIVFFDFETPEKPCCGTVSVSRVFYDKYEDDIRRMLCPREISDWEYNHMLEISPSD